MLRATSILLYAAAIAALACTSARADFVLDLKACYSTLLDGVSAEQTLAGCDNVIASGKLDTQNLAEAYESRALGDMELDQWANASGTKIKRFSSIPRT